MPECSKRQNEVYKGLEQFRCINPEAETNKQLVVLQQCEVCPVRKLRKETSCCSGGNKEAGPKLYPLPNEEEGFPSCPHRVVDGGKRVCSITLLPVDKEICGRCDASVREHEATFGEKITNYFGALRRWAASGCPTRTMEERAELFNNHCNNGCDRYDPVKKACKNCGCSVNADGAPLENKLAMATEHCPLGRF